MYQSQRRFFDEIEKGKKKEITRLKTSLTFPYYFSNEKKRT